MFSRSLLRVMRVTSNRNYSINSGRSGSLWTSENVVVSPFKEVELPNTTVTEHVWENIGKWPEKVAVTCGITNRSYTYQQLYKYSRNLAANLRKRLRIVDCDVICIMMPNSPEYPIAVLGVIEAGAEVTTINPIYTAHEVQRQLTLSKPKIIIGSPETVPVIKEAVKQLNSDIPIISVTPENRSTDGTISFKEFAFQNADHNLLKEVSKKSDDIAILPYSSGTTGLPKGVELTHRNIVVNCVQQDVDGVKQYNDTTTSHQDSVMAVLPFYHIYGLGIILLHKLSVGAKLVTLPKFQPNTFLAALKDHKINLLYAAPPIVLFLGAHDDVKKQHLDSVQKIMCGAAPVPKQDIDKTLQKVRSTADFIQVYGLTETSPLATAMKAGNNAIAHKTAGFAISNTQLKIVDAEFKTLGPNQTGELLIKGPQVMKGYRNNEEATRNAITEDGWFKTGDLCTIHEDGSIAIADRLKELIKVKGYQVPPAELESLIKEHPAVLDAGVVGIPDRKTGEAPRAFVVLKNGHKVKEEELVDFVKERVASFKRIKDVVFLDSLPKNPSGKLLRRVLKELSV